MDNDTYFQWMDKETKRIMNLSKEEWFQNDRGKVQEIDLSEEMRKYL